MNVPFAAGMPSAPGYVPKYVSNDRFSCMITTTCLMTWMSAPRAPALVVVGVTAPLGAGPVVVDAVDPE